MTPLPLPLRVIAVLWCLLLGACAHNPPPGPALGLLHDELFAPGTEPIDAASVFALSPAMREYADTVLQSGKRFPEPRRALVEALYSQRQLRLSYDAGSTRNAAEAFDARAGNCLSLVIMTAAFAKHLGLPVSFQNVVADEYYSRVADLTLASGHVNLVLGRPSVRSLFNSAEARELTIDFLPADELRGQRTQPLAESTIVAMYFNNRAAEALAAGRLADGYAWARAAMLHDPGFHPAVNTLAVVYARAGHAGPAEAALRDVLAHEPDNTAALSNLAGLLRRAGRAAEAAAVAAHLARVQPYPPFHFFELGRLAMAAGNYGLARDHFDTELRRQPYQSEVHFWAAQADWRLGYPERAARHLRLAIENSGTLQDQKLYAAKLDHLRALKLQ